MVFLFDPILLGLYVLGYVVMLVAAAFIAPKIAKGLAGKFSLYTSMIILGALIVLSTALIIYLIVAFALQELVQIYGMWLFVGLVVFAILMNVVMYIISPYLINMMYRARPDEELQRYVDEVAKKLNYKGKLKAVSVEGPPNAFAYGNIFTGRYVAVTESLRRMMNEEELKAVIGHEIGHHKHKDNLFMLLFGILPSIIFYLGYSMIAGSGQSERPAVMIGIGILAIVFSFIIQLLVLSFSRLREYYADIEGAKATSKETMQYALAKIHKYYGENREEREEVDASGFRALFIYALVNAVANPLVKIDDKYVEELKKEERSDFTEFLSTHPPISKRLRFLDEAFR